MEENVPKSSEDKTPKRQLHVVVFFWVFLLYMEVLFHILMFGDVNLTLIYPILFSLFLGVVLAFLCRLFPRRVGQILALVLVIFISALFCAEVIYQNVFSTYFLLFGVLSVAGQALDFLSIIGTTMISCLGYLLLLFVFPVGVGAYLIFRTCDFSPLRRIRPLLLSPVFAAAFYLLLLGSVYLGGRGVGSAYELYVNNLSVDSAVETLGVSASTFLSGRNAITGRTISSDIYMEEEAKEEEPEEIIDTSPNILDIDFDQIIADSGDNADVEKLCDYMRSLSGTNKNEYTGLFEGYNVIWITAEGFSGYCMSKEFTPTLWKMASQGFVFEHYYSPEYYGSTTGGEWSNLTGTVPNNGSYVSMSQAGRKGLNLLFTAGRQSTRLGYHTTGWHNNTYTYYYRDISFPNMGYEWYGSGKGYDPEINEATGKPYWPQSDVRLIDQSFPEYASEEPFMTYYMTVSGHMDYNWDGNAMSGRHEEDVRTYAEEQGLEYEEKTLAYLAANKELDLAMEELLADLKEAGIADRTVIIMACDHVPYDDMEVLDDLAGRELDYIDRYANALFIYAPSMEEPVVVDKYCCSIDILATVSNLMGWDYDSRMLVGQDILSDAEQFVMFPNLSFISGKVIYNAESGEVTSLTGEEVDDDYLASMTEKAQNWYTISDLLFATDFFSYVEGQMPEVSEETLQKIEELRPEEPEAEETE